MTLGSDKTTVGAVIPVVLKQRLKLIAKQRRWSLSQTVGALIEDSIDQWTTTLGINIEDNPSPRKRRPKSES